MAADGAAVCCAEAKADPQWPPEDTTAALMRTLRVDRAGSTESAVVTSGVESGPSSPSRPVTPGCCRGGGDSEDSGLGPSPAKGAPPPPLALDEALRRFLMEDGSSSSTGSQEAPSLTSSSASSSSAAETEGCKWLHCPGAGGTDLLGHIRKCHVPEQQPGERYVCLWVGCKVFERGSSSRSWLERHVLLHGGSKPFACIVAGCRQRFGSELALQRHVNSHFHAPKHPPLRTRLRRQHKRRRRPQDNKSKDFFDDATMEHVRHNLFQLNSVDGISSGGPPSAITFHSSVVARRVDISGKVYVLLRWSPQDVLPDSWVPESSLLSHLERSIPISQLPPQLPCMATLTKAGLLPRPAKRKRK